VSVKYNQGTGANKKAEVFTLVSITIHHEGNMKIQPFLFHIRYMENFSVPFPCFFQHILTTGIDSHSTLVTVNTRSQDSFFHCIWDDMFLKKFSKI